MRVEKTACDETHASDMNIAQLTSQYQITEKLDSLGLFAKRMCERIEKVSLDKCFSRGQELKILSQMLQHPVYVKCSVF